MKRLWGLETTQTRSFAGRLLTSQGRRATGRAEPHCAPQRAQGVCAPGESLQGLRRTCGTSGHIGHIGRCRAVGLSLGPAPPLLGETEKLVWMVRVCVKLTFNFL